MTYEERERMFAKECLSTKDVAELFNVDGSQASQIIMQIKRRQGDRLGKKGKIHIQDYFDYFNLPPSNYRPQSSIVVANTLAERLAHELARSIERINDKADDGHA